MPPADPRLPKAIANVADGQLALITGKARLGAAHPPLVSPVGKRPCAYYEVRDGPGGPPSRREGIDFLVEDSTGRALVVLRDQPYEVTLVARVAEEAIAVLDADIHQLSESLRARKAELRSGVGLSRQRELQRTMRADQVLATLLCAIRAHARGRLHMGDSLADQGSWIRRMSAAQKSDAAAGYERSLLVVCQEATIEDGQEVEVWGYCRWEVDPDPGSAMAGYRERPRLLAIRAPANSQLSVVSQDAARGLPPELANGGGDSRSGRREPDKDKQRSRLDRGWLLVIGAAIAGALIALL